MSEPQSLEAEFRTLHLASERFDRNSCWGATQRLLRRLSARQAVLLVREFVTRRLPVFERHQPGVHWPREFIDASAPGLADGRTWPEGEDDFSGPGANSFTSAVEALWKASLSTQEEQRRSELLADALVGALNAERVEHWGARHPERWALWYRLASSGLEDPRMVEIQLTILRDPDARRIEKEAWKEAAQLLKEALNTSAPESH